MKKRFYGVVAVALAATMIVGLAGCTKANKNDKPVTGEHTYHGYATALATNWNPHTWEMNSDDAMVQYLATPWVDMSVINTETQEWAWIFEGATSITDVTKDHQDDLDKYKCTLAEGKTSADVTEGYVYEIKLNPELRWEDGTKINADSYIYSMERMLSPEMKNYRANNYYGGDYAVAGGYDYFYSGSVAKIDNGETEAIGAVADLTKGDDGAYVTADGGKVLLAVGASSAWCGGDALADYVGAYADAYFNMENWDALAALCDEDGYVVATDDAIALLASVISTDAWNEDESNVPCYMVYEVTFPEASYDVVGFYKVDDYTVRYVGQQATEYNMMLGQFASPFLVYEPLYEKLKTTSGDLVTTSYGTSKETSMSYGKYKLESFQPDKQMTLVQNEEWYGWEKTKDGYLVSFTDFEIDGKKVQQYLTTKIVTDVMTDDAAKQAFLKGELDSWTPSASDLVTYSLSDQMYKSPETYTERLFFNTNLDALKQMDVAEGNKNSVVMSNIKFRKALSLAIDRAEWVGVTPGFTPAYAIMNDLYYYDIYNDPTSKYRSTDAAKTAICNLYGVEFGEGKAYKTLDEAYASLSGYNLTEAQALMTEACKELVEAGLYKENDEIVIRIGWSAGPIDSTASAETKLIEEYLNKAADGTGIGKITLDPIGNLENRYEDVPNGKFAIGFGAWGGAAFYPFGMFQVYCDPDYVAIHEAACWNPSSEELTLNVKGQDVTMTWQAWSQSMEGTGKFASEDFETKIGILAGMEENYLKNYYCVPLASMTTCEMISYKTSYFVEDYNIMYGFGGLRLLKYNYTDEEWSKYVAEQGGELSYE